MSAESQRLDKWLWYARFLKTRTGAGKFVAAGKVRVNRLRVVKPGHTVSPGDILTFTLHHRLRIVEVRSPGARRGPADEARTLYEDLSPAPPDGGGEASGTEIPARREAGSGRPTKRERRQLDAWLDQDKQ